jgi:hypothetical protein
MKNTSMLSRISVMSPRATRLAMNLAMSDPGRRGQDAVVNPAFVMS